MQILIEGTPLFYRRTGVGQYTKRLLDYAIKQDAGNTYTVFAFLFAGKKIRDYPLNAASNALYRFIRFMPGRVYNKLLKAHVAPPVDLLLGTRADVWLWPNFVSWPLSYLGKNIIVIYDLSYIYHAQYSDSANRRYLETFVPRSIANAAHIITISKNAKREILEYYKVSPASVSIINPAVDHDAYVPLPRELINPVLDKFNINKKYILYAGTLEPRKNIVGILEAYAALPQKLRVEYQLVLAGGKGWLDKDISKKLADLEKLNIVTTGYVADEDLPALYSGASLFLYPSNYEGFGMPPLEAMACGVPVITSNNSSLPEVVGDAGIMINVADKTALKNEIVRVLSDKKLAKALREKGLKQAQKFTWQKSGKQFVELIEKVGRS